MADLQSKFLSVIGCRSDDASAAAPADDDSLALETRLERLLDRDEKRIHIDVEIPAHG
jgi:hypothetical protein